MRRLGSILAWLGVFACGFLLLVERSQGSPLSVAFADPERVTIQGYDGDAMEPFLSRDGRFLLFNNRNDPPEKPISITRSGSTT